MKASEQLVQAAAVFVLLVVAEVIRQSTHVHALVYRDFSRAGLAEVPASIFLIPPTALPAWVLWLGALTVTFQAVCSLLVKTFGRSMVVVFYGATLGWIALFLATWLAFVAFGLATAGTAAIALAGAWVESLLIAGAIVYWPWGTGRVSDTIEGR